MKQKAIVVDLDNTLVDTAIRKLEILRNDVSVSVSTDVSLDFVRSDYHLLELFGDEQSLLSKSFLNILDSEDSIRNFPAPLFQNALPTLKIIHARTIPIYVLTARSEDLRTVTREELTRLGIYDYISGIIFKPSQSQLSDYDFKKCELASILIDHNVIATISDRPEDIRASHDNYIPAICLLSTMTSDEIPVDNTQVGLFPCKDWWDIKGIVTQLMGGIEEMEALRASMSRDYASWLGHIDEKCRITVTIAAAIAALNGALLQAGSRDGASLQADLGVNGGLLGRSMFEYAHLVSLLLSVAAMVFSVYAFTSRHTSGRFSSRVIWRLRDIMTPMLRLISPRTKEITTVPSDPVKYFNRAFDQNDIVKSRLHIQFFYDKYKSFDPESLLNMRLLELRAAIYSKAHYERIAAHLLLFAIVCTSVAFVIGFFSRGG